MNRMIFFIALLLLSTEAFSNVYTPQWMANQCPQQLTQVQLLAQHDDNFGDLIQEAKDTKSDLKKSLKEFAKLAKSYCGVKMKSTDVSLKVDRRRSDVDIFKLDVDRDGLEVENEVDGFVNSCNLSGYEGYSTRDTYANSFYKKLLPKGAFNLTDSGENCSAQDKASIIHQYADGQFECGGGYTGEVCPNTTEEASPEVSCDKNNKVDYNKLAAGLEERFCKGTSNCKNNLKDLLQTRSEMKQIASDISESSDALVELTESYEDVKEEALENVKARIAEGKLEAHCPSGICYQKKKASAGDNFERLLGGVLGVGSALWLADRTIDQRSRLGYSTPSGALAGVGIAAGLPFLLGGQNSSSYGANSVHCQHLSQGYTGVNNNGHNYGNNALFSMYGPNAYNILAQRGLNPHYSHPFLEANIRGNAELFPGANAGLFPGANAGLFPGANAGLFPGANAGLFPGANAGLFLGANAGLFPGANAGLFPGANAGLFLGANAGLFPGANAGIFSGINRQFNPYGHLGANGQFEQMQAIQNARFQAQIQAQQAYQQYLQRRAQNQQVAQRRLQGLYSQLGSLQSQISQVYTDYASGGASASGSFGAGFNINAGFNTNVNYNCNNDSNSRNCRSNTRRSRSGSGRGR